MCGVLFYIGCAVRHSKACFTWPSHSRCSCVCEPSSFNTCRLVPVLYRLLMKSSWSLRRAWTRTTWLVENNIDFVFVGSRARVDHAYWAKSSDDLCGILTLKQGRKHRCWCHRHVGNALCVLASFHIGHRHTGWRTLVLVLIPEHPNINLHIVVGLE